MDHESTRLSDEERRILAEIEHRLRGRQHSFLGRFRRRTRRPRRPLGRRAQWFSWTGVAVSSVLLVGGLVVGAVWVAALGFIGVVGSLFVVTADVVPARVVERLRRRTRLGDDETPR